MWFVSTAIPAVPLNLQRLHYQQSLTVLAWGGLHGGSSVALVLRLPASPCRDAPLGVPVIRCAHARFAEVGMAEAVQITRSGDDIERIRRRSTS